MHTYISWVLRYVRVEASVEVTKPVTPHVFPGFSKRLDPICGAQAGCGHFGDGHRQLRAGSLFALPIVELAGGFPVGVAIFEHPYYYTSRYANVSSQICPFLALRPQ